MAAPGPVRQRSSSQQFRQRQQGADGIRVIALLAVLLYHLRPEILPGGFLGVVIFFVLAGFYTTRSFVVHPRIDIVDFYRRRARKLWPPMIFAIALLALFSGFFLPEVFRYMKSSAPPALLGYLNIHEILADHSYFARFGNFDPLTHLWALALEMQFYLLFPLLYAGLSALCDRLPGRLRLYGREFSGYFLLLLGALSALYMGLRYTAGADPSSVYYDSLARLHAFFNGAAACLIVAGQQMRHAVQSRKRTPVMPRMVTVIAWPALLQLVSAFFFANDHAPWLYRGGFYTYSLLVVIFLIFGGRKPVPGMGFMASPPFQYLARRSYAIYIWQYALMMVLEAAFRFSTLPYFIRLVLQLLLLFALAEITWRLFEESGQMRQGFRSALAALLACLTAAMMVLPAPVAPSGPTLDQDAVMQAIESNASRRAALFSSAPSASETSAAPSETSGAPTIPNATEAPTEPPAPDTAVTANPFDYSEEQIAALSKVHLSCIGDSVLAMATEGIYDYLPNAYINAEVSRHLIAGMPILNELEAQGFPTDIFVICLATNGDIYENQLDPYVEIAGKRPIIFVNTIVPNTWEQPNNALLSAFAEKHDNVWIADWYSAAKNHPEYFYDDATHPVPDGGLYYDRIILDVVLQIISAGQVAQ